MSEPLRVLVLTSSTGGGHDMRARSFQQWVEKEKELGLEIKVFRPLETSCAHFKFGVWLYNFIQYTGPFLHHIYWNWLEHLPATAHAWQLGEQAEYKNLLEQYRPRIVLSVHPMLNHGFFDLTRTVLGAEQVRCITYCGEMFGGYGFSRHWANPNVDLFIGATPDCVEAARQRGVSEAKSWCGGFMLRPDFWATTTTNSQPNAAQDKPFRLLLGTGAVGANNHLAVVRALDDAGLNMRVIALCGKRQETKLALDNYQPMTKGFSIEAVAYTNDVAGYMRKADAVFARPGTGTTSEAIMARCPIIHNCIGLPMPQEWITIKYLRKHGVAAPVYSVHGLVRCIQTLLQNPQEYIRLKQTITQLLPEPTPRDILKKLRAIAVNGSTE